MLILIGCGATPTGPSPDRYRQPRINVFCQTTGEDVVCTAKTFDVRYYLDSQDVTKSATWSVVPSDIGRFQVPGVLIPLHAGEAAVHVASDGLEIGDAPLFLIGPGRDARWMEFLGVAVVEADQKTPVIGAFVSMLDGYRRGASCNTNMLGYCSIDRVLTGETFTASVSKLGYTTATVTYRVDPPVGPAGGNGPFLTVTLAKP